MSESATQQHEDVRRPPGSFTWFLVKLVLAALIFRTFFFSPFSIPSESMLPNLANGDYLLAAKWPYGFSRYSLPMQAPLIPGRIFAGTPERGDVVIFKHPIDGADYIKRAVGLPGDIIAMEDGVLTVNEERAMQERLPDFVIEISPNTACHVAGRPVALADGARGCSYPRLRETLPGGASYDILDLGPREMDDFGPVTVPDGRIFVLGDNRDNSQDSRFPAQSGGGVGMVPLDLLVGRASLIAWSTDGSSRWVLPWTWFTAARGDRIGTGL